MLLPWQTGDWAHLAELQARMPHALLLQATPGIGEIGLARHLAQALLCEQPTAEHQPCGTCAACGWFNRGNHPDFRLACPENLAEPLPAAGEEAGTDKKEKTKAPSKEIRIEQIRELVDFASVGSHRQGRRVILLYPAETLNVHAANALLKTLEEPPADVVFILVTTQIDRLLPTILSRCRRVVLTQPDAAAAGDWLASQSETDGESAAAALAEAGGAPLSALELLSPQERGWRDWLLAQLADGAGCNTMACAEQLYKGDLPAVLATVQRWCFDMLACTMAQRARFYPARADALQRCASRTAPAPLLAFLRELANRRAVQNHPLNTRVLLEALFMQYRQLFAAR